LTVGADAINELALEVEVEVEQTAQTIQEVEFESDRIGSVVDVIKNIAEQTNLLALNAAIKAARAGEIESMIQSLKNGTQRAVSVMALGREKVDQNVTQTRHTLDSLDQINQALETINRMNAQIATADEEQRTMAEEIKQNIFNINDHTKQTSHRAKQTSETVCSLGNHAATLQEVIQQFKFSGDNGLDFSAAKSAHLA
jgi:methyl-accepting chemotaxis protein